LVSPVWPLSWGQLLRAAARHPWCEVGCGICRTRRLGELRSWHRSGQRPGLSPPEEQLRVADREDVAFRVLQGHQLRRRGDEQPATRPDHRRHVPPAAGRRRRPRDATRHADERSEPEGRDAAERAGAEYVDTYALSEGHDAARQIRGSTASRMTRARPLRCVASGSPPSGRGCGHCTAEGRLTGSWPLASRGCRPRWRVRPAT
jgi:hypothetical protein